MDKKGLEHIIDDANSMDDYGVELLKQLWKEKRAYARCNWTTYQSHCTGTVKRSRPLGGSYSVDLDIPLPKSTIRVLHIRSN